MIHCACNVQTSITPGTAVSPRLIIDLTGNTGPTGFRLRGRIEIEGLDGWRLDALQAALNRSLGHHATLMLGPQDMENLLDGENVEEAARRICRDYALTPAELAGKLGLSPEVAVDLLTQQRKRQHRTVRRVSTLALRLASRPTLGEVLRRQRTGHDHQKTPRIRANVASQVGVSDSLYALWEDDRVRPEQRDLPHIARVLGLSLDDLQSLCPRRGPSTGLPVASRTS